MLLVLVRLEGLYGTIRYVLLHHTRLARKRGKLIDTRPDLFTVKSTLDGSFLPSMFLTALLWVI